MASTGYASRLSKYNNKGVCGLDEVFDTERQLQHKVATLARKIQQRVGHTRLNGESKKIRIVIITGAGISTAAGIPDFRGPNGIWTKEQQQKQSKKRKRSNSEANVQHTAAMSTDIDVNRTDSADKSAAPFEEISNFAHAVPTLTHRAITYLVSKGIVSYVVTQNVDGLHRRSGLSRSKHCTIHGCVFTEVCSSCKCEHYRDYEVGGMSFQPTGRYCEKCKGVLVDTLLDWEDSLPESDYERAQQECQAADLVICLGTSLRIEPVNNLPLLSKEYVIVNLQKTSRDDAACMIIRGKCDKVMSMLMQELGYPNWELTRERKIERLWIPPRSKKV